MTPMLVYWGRRDFRERVDVIEATCAACGLAGALIVGFLVDHSSAALMFMYLPIPWRRSGAALFSQASRPPERC